MNGNGTGLSRRRPELRNPRRMACRADVLIRHPAGGQPLDSGKTGRKGTVIRTFSIGCIMIMFFVEYRD
jgi:hypothetical protein